MKSLPENEFWKAIGKRLENYQEDPADDWDKIAGAVASGNTGVTNLNRSSDIVASVVLAFILGFQVAYLQGAAFKTQHPDSLHAGLTEKLLPKIHPGMGIKNNSSVQDQNKNESQPAFPLAEKRTASLEKSVSEISSSEKEQRDENLKVRSTIKDQAAELRSVGDVENSYLEESVQPTSTASITPIPPDAKKDTLALIVMVKKDSAVVTKPVVAEKEKRRRKFRPSVYVQLTPSLAYQKIIPSKDDDITIQELNSPGVISSDRFGWSAEAGFQMQVAPKLELYTSLSYYQQQQVISYTYASAENTAITQAPDSWSFEVSPGSATKAVNYKMRNAGISTGVLYFLKGKKLMHKIGGGIHYQKGLMNRKEGDSYVNSNSDYFGYQLLYRLEYVLNRKTGFFVQPVFTHAVFSNEDLDEPFTIKPFRAGIGFGVVYHF
jgi:hypothetical protein